MPVTIILQDGRRFKVDVSEITDDSERIDRISEIEEAALSKYIDGSGGWTSLIQDVDESLYTEYKQLTEH